MAPTPPRSLEANLLFFYYRDLHGAQQFYEEVLGLPRLVDYGYATIHQISPTTYLGLVDERQGRPGVGLPKSVTLSFITAEVDAWYHYLIEQKIKMHHPLADATRHPTRGFVALDPEGYFLEFETFLPHSQNDHLNQRLQKTEALYPAAAGNGRPAHLGFQGNVFWLYYDDLVAAEQFYGQVMGLPLLVDQGFAKLFGSSATGFVGLVDGAQGLHTFSQEKAVIVSFLTSTLSIWFEHLMQAPVELVTPTIVTKNEALALFVAHDVGGYMLEFDTFLDCEPNQRLLATL